MMTISELTTFLGWTSALNLGFLILAAVILMAMQGTIIKIHASLSGVSAEELPKIYMQFLGQYKTLVIALNVAPYLALRIMA